MQLLCLSHHHVLAAQGRPCPVEKLSAKGGGGRMRQQIANIVIVASLLLSPGTAFSANGPDEPELESPVDEDIESIIVSGQRPEFLRQLMQDFIVEIGDPTSRSRGYARWQHRLCVGIYNLPDQTTAQFIADTISLIALETGLQTGSPGCKPNLQIVFSPDARELASTMVEDSPRMFRPFGGAGETTQGIAALEQFKTSEAPVRWWQITMAVDETGLPAIDLPGVDAPLMRGVASRLTSTISDEIWGNLIIVDAGKVANVTWPQLADYLAMVSLAQVDPNALPSGSDSILNLFRADTPPSGMRDIDRTYLRALYEMDAMLLPQVQRGTFPSRMVRVQRKMEDEE